MPEPSALKNSFEDSLRGLLRAWIDLVDRRAGLVIGACAILTLFAGFHAATRLGINSDNTRMVAEDLPSRRNHEAFAKLFPNLDDALLVVIDAGTPELARNAASALEERLAADSEFIASAYLPGGGNFFEEHGLLYRSPEELDVFVDKLSRLQPILAELEGNPSIASLAELVVSGLAEAGEGEGVDPEEWTQILDAVGNATVRVYSEFPLALSWEEIFVSGSAVEVSTRRVLVVHPILDFESFLSAGRVMNRIREHARELGLDSDAHIGLRITGNPALNYEEILGLAWDLGLGGALCFIFVAGVLKRAFRSFKLVAAALLTLLVGLVWSSACAASVVGSLNLISAAFGVLFIGLGVDFSIHLGMAYAVNVREGAGHEEALREAAASVGGSLLICTLTTAIGFFVFVPTDYLGVSELGLIAGCGMFIIVFLTLTLLPALLTKFFRLEARGELGGELRFRATWWRFGERNPGAIIAASLCLFVLALWILPGARFDINVIQLRDPTTESVQTFNELLAQSGAMSPWFINSIARDLPAAERLAERMRELKTVSSTLTLADYVPPDQDEKLEILADLGYMMDTPPQKVQEGRRSDLKTQIAALQSLRDFLDQPWLAENDSPLRESILLLHRKLDAFLERVSEDQHPAEALARLDEMLLSGLPDQLERMRRAIETDPIELDRLPEDLIARMSTEAGQARIQIFPRHDLSDGTAFDHFTAEVLELDPKAAGVPINLVGFGQATRSSFRQALAAAVILIGLLLWGLWRRPRPVLLVLSPLALSSVCTAAAMVLLDIPFNFGNIIVIPLLLGIGVDSGIHLVHRSEQLVAGDRDLMDSTTARAVFYSALTTTVSFGSLAFSSHRGMASLGVVLCIGMLLTVICNLIVLPALLRRSKAQPSST